MRKTVLYGVLLTLAGTLLTGFVHERREAVRLRSDLYALDDTIRHYRTRLGREAASVQALRLRCSEFERLRKADAAEIRRLGIRLRRAEASARTALATRIEVRVPVHDTVLLRDTVRFFRWHDTWTTVEGTILRDSAACRVESVDTLFQVVHRVPRRFLFIRWGTKAIRQEIVSRNPHTRIVHAEYIELER